MKLKNIPKKILDYFEEILFKGHGHLKRGQGITMINIKWNSVYSSKRQFYLPKNILKCGILRELKKNVSINLVNAIKYGKKVKSKITGIIGRDGGFTKKNSNTCILVPTVDRKLITPSAESMQAVIWHLIVSHPKLLKNTTKWESIQNN
jgi:hypothetical protein